MKTFSSAFGKAFLVIGLPVCIVFTACAGADREEKASTESYKKYADESASSPNAAMDSVSSSSNISAPMVVGKANDTNHVFMRTADMRFSVKDVRAATYEIEKIVRKYEGFVVYTGLKGTKYLSNTTRITKDSVIEMYRMNVNNEITLRVPNTNLDSTLIELNTIIEFMDSRIIKADDVKLQLLAGALSTKRKQIHINKLDKTITDQGKKLPETSNALNDLDYNQLTRDEQQLSLMDLKDKITYSTVTLSVYQPEVTEYKKVLIPAHIEPYSPSFSERTTSSLSTSLAIGQAILLFFIAIWPLLFLLIVIWIITKWLIRSKFLNRVFKI